MIFCHMQTEVSSCSQGTIINRPLAGTVKRGRMDEEDKLNEQQLLNDEKQCAEHIMLVDLGRNDVGRVCLDFFICA